MSDTLYLRLPPGATPGCALEWVLLEADGAVAAQGIAMETPLPVARRLVALVPGAEVSLATAELPTRSPTKALQLAPFALEEQLAGDIDDLHFAVGGLDEAGKASFVVCEHAAMERWLEVLQAVGGTPASIVPDFLAVPENPGHTVLWVENGQVVVRHPGEWPVLLDADPLEDALEIAGVLGRDHPPHVLCYCMPQDEAAQGIALGAVASRLASWRAQVLVDGALGTLAVSAHHGSPPNLLQGAYASRGTRRSALYRWRIPVALGLALLLVAAVDEGLAWSRARAEAKHLDGLIADAAHQAMPDVHKLVDARRQVEARLAQSPGSAAPGGGLLAVMAALAATRETAPAMEIGNLNFDGDTTDLQLQVPDAATLEQAKSVLAAHGFAVQVQMVPGAAGPTMAARMRLTREGTAP